MKRQMDSFYIIGIKEVQGRETMNSTQARLWQLSLRSVCYNVDTSVPANSVRESLTMNYWGRDRPLTP